MTSISFDEISPFLPDTIIRTVTVFAESLFQGESFVVYDRSFLSKKANLLISRYFIQSSSSKSSSREHCYSNHSTSRCSHSFTFSSFHWSQNEVSHSIVSGFTSIPVPSSTLFHVFETVRPLPMFSMYLLIENSSEREPKGYVTFYINERISRVCRNFHQFLFAKNTKLLQIIVWINENFLLSEDFAPNAPNLHVTFLAVRTDSKLVIKMQNNGQVRIPSSHLRFD